MTPEKILNFMGQRKIAAVFSILLLVGSIVSLTVQGLNFGLDFTGGTQLEYKYETAADLNAIRATLEEAGYTGAVVVNYGSDTNVLMSLQQSVPPSADPSKPQEIVSIGEVVLELLESKSSEEIELLRTDVVGAQVGEELANSGGMGMLLALAVVMAYVAVRFQFKFSVGAVAALIHDVVIVLGVFSFFQLTFDLTVLAAVLAVIGYSLNDTIVVADRIRENFRLIRKGDSEEVINISLTQTLGRTMITSLTTLLVLLALFFVGGEMIHNFALALIVGVVIGTYSSIYVSANILMAMHIDREDLIPVVKEGEELDELP
ncbi:protein translocase subunit SecF [Saccharophagus degradans]|uniref:Protein-export membrane protein SecF n=1 Tax=Saccharophagus degradans TaxID=86304 RepID=A0AAW7X4W0_9GAMM|nr:protein translocase subunit SecF [Saccharophagus degradans]MDO6421927.1 protein translocase subunit SecF [Saccharophagus degradans]MDO6606380.1 protein translocase subunit SecF [Saccharophagus degradans]